MSEKLVRSGTTFWLETLFNRASIGGVEAWPRVELGYVLAFDLLIFLYFPSFSTVFLLLYPHNIEPFFFSSNFYHHINII